MNKITWCPGCGNFGLFRGFQQAVKNKKKVVAVAGIGCHAKIVDYLENMSSFYGLHGRAIPVATGIKLANPKLDVVCFTGDGDCYNEGIAHLIHAAKRNSNITVIVHNNRTFALTIKQFTALSPKGFPGTSTPDGSPEIPLNGINLAATAGATFIARGYSNQPNELAEIIKKAIEHKGFSLVEVLQPCIAWYNTTEEYNKRTYNTQGEKALTEWDYNNGGKIPLGIFREIQKPTFEEEIIQ
jgi:2-oxoglutarate/2-oxoacid ferredoxin oxidoreductase subunit beta